MPKPISKKTYKIRISPERVLGPLDLERVTALILKGVLQGQEPTSVEPFHDWAPLTNFPELSELLLKKLELDATRRKPESAKDAQAASSTRPIISTEATKTMAKTQTVAAPNPAQQQPEREDESFGMPTLLDIKIPEKPKEPENPDNEKTQMFLPAKLDDPAEIPDGATRILTTEALDTALAPFDPEKNRLAIAGVGPEGPKNIFGKKLDASQYISETGKRRLMSRNFAALLAMALLAIGVWSQQEEEASDPYNLKPQFHKFPYIEVNIPPRLGLDPDPGLSADLTEQGEHLLEKETPSAYIRAVRQYFYIAVGKNPQNYDARAMLASSYMRLSETVPRDKRLFETIDKLLNPAPPPSRYTPEYVVARAEYFQMLNRYDQADDLLNAYSKVRVTAEILYQRALVASEHGEGERIKNALTLIAKAIPPEKVQAANPRHLLFYASLLEKAGQQEATLQLLKRLFRESKFYGPGLLYHADYLQRHNQPLDALKMIRLVIENPSLLEGKQRPDAFAVAARVFESLAQTDKQNSQALLRRALLFANLAFSLHHNREELEETLFRIKSKLPEFKNVYTSVLQGKQKEAARQMEQAENIYVAALEKNRQDPMPFLLLGRVLEDRGEIIQAIDRYKKALNTPERPIEAALALARLYIKRFQIEDAKTMINTASQMNNKARFDQVNFLKGQLQMQAHRSDLAEPYFNLAVERNSRLVDLYVELGDLETEQKNQHLAEFYYSVALRYDPYHPKAMLGLADVRFHLDSPSHAISFLKDRLSSQPNSAAIMTNLAIIYLRTGDQLSGKNYLQNAIRNDGHYAEAFRLLGDLTKEEGNHQPDYNNKRHSYRYALASYEMYSKLAPTDPEGFKATADLYFDIRDLGAAAKNYHQVLALTPNYPDVRLRLAQISRNGGDATAAQKWLDEEIKINPRSDAALVEKGNIFMAQVTGNGDKNSPAGQALLQQATKAFTEAARINEKNADALFGLGVVYHLQGGYDNALSLFARVIKLDPLKQDVYWQMGLIYQKQNNRAKAVQAFLNYKGVLQESDPARRADALRRADEKIRELSK
jgi:tetratricopeptide (TPR) repeat protein